MLASEVMTVGAATVRMDASIGTAIALMADRHLSGLPVVDEYGRLAGILTEGDLLRRVEIGTDEHPGSGWLDRLLGSGRGAGTYIRTHSRHVGDLMTRDVVTATEGTPIEEIISLMERKHVKRVPIVRDDKIVGVVSRIDLVRALGHALEATAQGETTDAAVGKRLQADLQAQRWFPARDVTIAVKDGVVTLQGIISDERARDALRVAAENMAGVAKVDDQLVWVDPAGAGLVF